MKLIETELFGVFIIELERTTDERGSYKRLWGKDEYAALGLDFYLNNVGLSANKRSGTLRGMHFQAAPFAEVKIVQCVRGEIYDVILDIRQDSATFGKWISVELSPGSDRAVYIPKGLAHGFQTLVDDSEVLYFISEKYDQGSASGVRWNDTRFNIKFPLDISVINDRDANYPDYV